MLPSKGKKESLKIGKDKGKVPVTERPEQNSEINIDSFDSQTSFSYDLRAHPRIYDTLGWEHDIHDVS